MTRIIWLAALLAVIFAASGDAQQTVVRPDQLPPLTLSPGLTDPVAYPNTYNTGNQTAAVGGHISPQFMWRQITTASPYPVATTDSAYLLEAGAAGFTFTLPTMGAAGSASYSFSVGVNGNYTVATSGGTTIYGCGVNGQQSITVGFDVTMIPTISGWKCSGSNNLVFSGMSYGPGMNLQTSPIPIMRRQIPTQIINYVCTPGVVVNATPANIDLMSCPDSSLPPNGSGCIYIGTGTSTAPTPAGTASCHAGTAATGGALQTITFPAPTIIGATAPATIWVVGSGTAWGTANALASSSGLIQLTISP